MNHRVLVVATHPKPTSLVRAALERVLLGLAERGDDVTLLDLDEISFHPALTIEEMTDPASAKIALSQHVEALEQCDQLVLVYPTWFGGPPARMIGWFDRVLRPGVGLDQEGRRKNIRRVDAVTTHGSSARVNMLQGNNGRVMLHRELCRHCHSTCRFGWNALYSLDQISDDECALWLDEIETNFGPDAADPQP